MKVLFVSSGNSKEFIIAPFIKSQGESLKEQDINVEYFPIKGKGIKGYLLNIIPLRKHLKKNNYDLIHAHYALTGWVTVMAFDKKPIIVSYMGCDTYGDYDEKGNIVLSSYINIILSKLLQFFIKKIIVKSKNLKKYIFIKKVELLPNGVNLDIFRSIDKSRATQNLGIESQTKKVLFLGSPKNQRKNYSLLIEAKKICSLNFDIINPYPVSHSEIPLYLNACDIFVLTSFNEGSPNVIKEAMACNCPIVSTDVGDVKKVTGETEGCYICSYDPNDVATKIESALKFNARTLGRERIKNLNLDSDSVAQKLKKIYSDIINES